MAVELATAYVTIVPSLQGSQGKIAEELGREGDSAGSLFAGTFAGSFLGNLASDAFAAAGRAIGELVGTGFREAAEAEVANAQLTAAIESTGNAANVSLEQMNGLASSIQAYSGQTDDSIGATQALLLRFQNIKNVGVDDIFNQATIAAADMAARLGGDASSQAQKLGRALEDPIAGLTSLSRQGVIFTDQQKAQVEAMVAAGDTLGAQKVILAQVNAAYGGSAEAFGGTFTGTVERVKRSFEDLTQNVMQGLLPIFKPIAEGLISAMQSLAPVADRVGAALSAGVGAALEAIGPIFSQIASAVGPLAAQFLELWATASPLAVIFAAIQPLLPDLLDAFGQLASTVGGALASAMQQLMPVFQQLAGVVSGALSTALAALLPVITQVVSLLGPVLASVLGAIVPIIAQIAPLFGRVVEALLPLVGAVLPLLTPLLSLVASLLEPIISLFTATLTPILSVVTVLIDLLIPVIEFLVLAMKNWVEGIVVVIGWFVSLVTGSQQASSQLSSIWNAVTSFFAGIWTSIVGYFRNGINQAVGFVRGLPGQVLSAVGNLGNLLIGAGRDLIQGFINGITSMIGAVGNAIGGVMDFVAGFFPHSPAERGPFSGSGWTDVKEAGLAIADQFNLGLNSATYGITAASFRVPGSTSNGFDPYALTPAAAGGFTNYGTIQVTDEAKLAEEVAIRQRRANALADIGTVVTQS